VTQKSKSNQDGTQRGILQERVKEETWKKNQKTRNSNWTSNLFDFGNTLKVTKKTPQRSTDFQSCKRNFRRRWTQKKMKKDPEKKKKKKKMDP
jgi:hypothetical protein